MISGNVAPEKVFRAMLQKHFSATGFSSQLICESYFAENNFYLNCFPKGNPNKRACNLCLIQKYRVKSRKAGAYRSTVGCWIAEIAQKPDHIAKAFPTPDLFILLLPICNISTDVTFIISIHTILCCNPFLFFSAICDYPKCTSLYLIGIPRRETFIMIDIPEQTTFNLHNTVACK